MLPAGCILMVFRFVGWDVSGGAGGMGVVDRLWWSLVEELVQSRTRWKRALRGRRQVWGGVWRRRCLVWFWMQIPDDDSRVVAATVLQPVHPGSLQSGALRGWRRVRARMNHGGGGRRWVQVDFVDTVRCVNELDEPSYWLQTWVRRDALRVWSGAREQRRREYEFPLTFA